MKAFESTLERDFITLLEFDTAVARYDEQPLSIQYRADGRTRRYTPDFLIQYRDGSKNCLCEIKYRKELFENWRDLKARLKAARILAAERGWRFHLFTEVEIRTPYLVNARFLLPYQRCQPNPADAELLLDQLRTLESSTPAALTRGIYSDTANRARLLPTLWNLVAERRIGTDLDQKLTMESPIWAR